MRLTTLARKVAITPTKLIDFLEEKGVELTKGINTKLDDLSVTMVKEAFLPDEIEDDLPVIEENQSETEAEIKTEPEFSPKMNTDENPIKEKIIVEIPLESIDSELQEDEAVAKEEILEEELIAEPQVEKQIEEEIEPIEEEKTGTIEDLENENPDEIDLIKVKKVKLDGIKVVGKIELPEKPKKEEVDSNEEVEEISKPEVIDTPRKTLRKTSSFDRNRKKNKNSRSPLSYEEKLKREEREKLRKLKLKKKEEKKRKQKYYQENLKTKTVAKPKKTKKNQSSVQNQTEKKVDVHKNPIKRLWAWLNGEYDNH